ncbi:MFS transporter [Neptunicella marina]|uniref:MFS transporter n=1 Tax=Neptunicella marina TaxID=2125989 RepID=A0A8J6ITQ3_9ALTE|nr:MFS transporter [Neptunicella marina]MBC3765238.1 MFS transporter [Neptunicella marina]
MRQIFSGLSPTVWVLMLAQCFIACTGPLIVFTGGFVGISIAPTPELATLPITAMVIGIAMFTLPFVRFVRRFGRKKGFIVAMAFGIANCFIAMQSIGTGQFWLLCLSCLLFGFPLAATLQFRFAAMESVAPEQAGKAVSTLLIAGLVAAFLGPELGLSGRYLLDAEFAGSYVLLAICLTAALIILLIYREHQTEQNEEVSKGRTLTEIARQPLFLLALTGGVCAYAVMSFIMTATPISMHVHFHHSLEQTKWVIQSHIVAMYLPSLFSGILIRKLGAVKLLISGIILMVICLIIGAWQQDFLHFWWALVLLGAGWNFMFVAATTLLPQSYEASEKLKVQGFNDFCIFSAQAIVSLSAGWVIQVAGWHTLLLLNIPLLALVVVSLFRASATLAPSMRN